jgi:HEAT repeat protein
MDPAIRASLILVLLVLFAASAVSAQEIPSRLLQVLPQAAEKLSSDDVRERASILMELVVPVPLSCTGELNLPFDLKREDYAYVVGRILEKDLRQLDERTGGYEWSYLTYLIAHFQMKEFAASVAAYLGEPFSGDLQVSIPYMLISTLDSLDAKEFDSKIVPYLDSPSINYQAMETLIRFKSKKAVPALLEKLSSGKDEWWALEKLVEIGAVEAGPEIAGMLTDEPEYRALSAIDALEKLDARAQAKELWQFVKNTKDEKSRAFAVAVLIRFGEREAIPLAIDKLKGIAQGTDDSYMLEFIDKLKPKMLVPALISLYNTKPPFFADQKTDERFRTNLVRILAGYKTPAAIPIYRANLIDRSDRWPKPDAQMAALLQELDAREALDDIISLFNEAAKGAPGSDSDYRAGELGIVLAKFDEPKTWKPLIDYVATSKYWDRGRIIEELNKHLDKKLWDRTHTLVPHLSPAEPFRTALAKISVETGIPISLENDTRRERRECFVSEPEEKDGILCGYANGTDHLYHVLTTLINSLDYPRRGQFTYITDKGTIRIMTVEKAVEWWRRNMLSAEQAGTGPKN